jgi:hypothetical protein
MVCTVLGLYTPSWCCYRYPEIRSNFIDLAKLSRFYLNTETESSLRNVMFCNINRTVFLDKDRMMDNVQKHNMYTNDIHVSPVTSTIHRITQHGNTILCGMCTCIYLMLLVTSLTDPARNKHEILNVI